jgi:hypothetical protein
MVPTLEVSLALVQWQVFWKKVLMLLIIELVVVHQDFAKIASTNVQEDWAPILQNLLESFSLHPQRPPSGQVTNTV